mmetsp:Transcript_4360/g.8724  ORF Transcript_4360/g.8724 Transcript_4360/m.8724 type:complete len:454 (-) Transcript_4360:43-1404(-)
MESETPRPSVGQMVKIVSSSRAASNDRIGLVGIILEDDGSNRPFKVSFDDEKEKYFKLGEFVDYQIPEEGARVEILSTTREKTEAQRIGSIGTIFSIAEDPLRFCVQFDDDSSFWYFASGIEEIPDDQANLQMAEESIPGPRYGHYMGTARDVTSPGDNVTWEIVFMEESFCSIECRSQISVSKGGSQPWKVEGTWEWDEDEEEVTIVITKDDIFGGPKLDRELTLPMNEDASITFKFANHKQQCSWIKPLTDPWELELAAQSMRELKARAVEAGLDTDGCIDRDAFENLLRRARRGGVLKDKSKAKDEAKVGSVSTAPHDDKSKAKDEAEAEAALAAPNKEPAAPAMETAAQEVKGVAAPAEAPVAQPQSANAAKGETATESAAADASGSPVFTLEQLTDKRIFSKLDVKSTEREMYLADSVFQELFSMPKADFAKLPKWKKDGEKKKHGLF